MGNFWGGFYLSVISLCLCVYLWFTELYTETKLPMRSKDLLLFVVSLHQLFLTQRRKLRNSTLFSS